MSKPDAFEVFLSLDLSNPELFSRKLISAANQLRSEDLGISTFDLTMNGDHTVEKHLFRHSLKSFDEIFSSNLSHTSSTISPHIKELVDSWENQQIGVVFRGTRLPEHISSFHLNDIHTTPQLDIASAYAGGLVNASTGIGSILNHNEVGFISEYHVPLTTKTYANFQHEDFIAGKALDSSSTLEHLKDKVKSLNNIPQEDFFLNNEFIPSSALKEWFGIAGKQNHYEAILSSETPVTNLYLRHKSGLIPINQNNPKWDLLLARTQEAILRDFYQIKPLEKALKQLHTLTIENSLLNEVKQMIQYELNQIIHTPWTAQTLNDISMKNSRFIENNSHFQQSKRVGSSMDEHKVYYEFKTQQLLDIVDSLTQSNSTQNTHALIEKYKHDYQDAMNKEFIKNNILSLRKEVNQDNNTLKP